PMTGNEPLLTVKRSEIPRTPPRPPGQLRTAVDAQRAAGDVLGFRIDQEQNAACDFFGRRQTADRQEGAARAQHLLGEKLPLARRVGPAWVDDVHADRV